MFAGLDATDIWVDQVQPRHSGTVNVLYDDGHVRTHSPGQIDPEVVDLQIRFWLPVGEDYPTGD